MSNIEWLNEIHAREIAHRPRVDFAYECEVRTKLGELICLVRRPSKEITEKDACLVATAPNLLEALENAREEVAAYICMRESWGLKTWSEEESLEEIDAAIAKAKGEA